MNFVFDAGGLEKLTNLTNFDSLPVSSLEGFPVQNNVLTEEIKINSKAASAKHTLTEDLATKITKEKLPFCDHPKFI